EVRHQRNRRVAEGQLAGQDRLRMTRHVHHRTAHRRVPAGLRAGREARTLHHDHRAAVVQVQAAGIVFDGTAASWAVRVGEVHVYRPVVVERLGPATGPVDELIRQYEGARPELRPQTTDRAGSQDLTYSDVAQGPDVGPVRDAVRREAVVPPVP